MQAGRGQVLWSMRVTTMKEGASMGVLIPSKTAGFPRKCRATARCRCERDACFFVLQLACKRQSTLTWSHVLGP